MPKLRSGDGASCTAGTPRVWPVAEARHCRGCNIGNRDSVFLAVTGKNGFTLIELLVVTAIIAMAGSVAFIQFQSYRARARDAERELEIQELQKALALYVTNKRVFPVASGPITGLDALSLDLINNVGVIPAVPLDPLNAGEYLYTYDSSAGKTYAITYVLETDSIPGKPKGLHTVTP